MTMIKLNKKAEAARATLYVAGFRKHYPNGSQVLTAGGGTVTVTVDQACARLTTTAANRAAVVAARASVKTAVAVEDASLPADIVFMNELEAMLRVQLGADPTAEADFGLAPKKARAPRTAAQRAVSAAKAKATRAARKAAKTAKAPVTAELVVTPEVTPSAAPAPAPAAVPVAPKA